MTLFVTWRGTLDFPALPERGLKVGGNRIVQRVFGGATTKARISPSQINGHDLITTDSVIRTARFSFAERGRAEYPCRCLWSWH
ncbi:hypothetical protein [Mesorhizobium sp. M0571]|uniref:hypothetical protein n=1 Tax=Mesorhizobium sp. M0571 TaxID=2956960 RepID=UPI0033390300